MSVIRSQPFLSASKRVLDWCAWYTRGLDPLVADERRDEIESDLHEHGSWAEESSAPSGDVRWAILARTVRGIPADLSWRAS